MAARRTTAREESWNSVHLSEASQDSYGVDDMEETSMPQLGSIGEVQQALHPLQATAERVGKQVEQFAQTLDQLGGRRELAASDCREVLPLVYDYERIATETVKRLKRQHEPKRLERLKRTWKKRLQTQSSASPDEENDEADSDDPNSTTVEDLIHWEDERQTWQLLRLMLQVQYPVPDDVPGMPEIEERFQRPRKTPKIHQFSSEHDVWNAFLEADGDMYEKHVVVEWLKTSADSVGEDIDTVVEQLETGADRGQGLWAHSWLYSKEAIKGAKRLRSWPQPLEPDSPGIETTLVTQDKSGPLVTQLDPDAFSRQDRKLEKEDVFFERAIWLACYEMIRRGHSWKAIREWCQDRVEVWRALSLRGDPRLSDGPQGSKDVLSGWQARSIWRRMCATAARNGGIDEYENAVYGILSGDLSSVEKVARGWDDHLFALYNSQLLHGFDFFTRQTFANSLPWEVLDKFGGSKFEGTTKPTLTGEEAWAELLQKDVGDKQAYLPFKIIQGAVIAKKVPELLANQGASFALALSQQNRVASSADIISTQGPTAEITIEDYELLRVFTHLALIFRSLVPWPNSMVSIEHLIIAYVDYLGKSGRQQLIPTYASFLSDDGSVACMASQLPTMVDTQERKMVMSLMNQYELDVPTILSLQLSTIIEKIPLPPADNGFPPSRILAVPHHRNELPHIESGFIGNEISDEDLDLINGMEWYLILDGHWDETMAAGVYVYKHLLRKGALVAARELAQRVPFATVSMSKTEALIGKAMNLGMLEDDEDYDGIPARDAPQRRNSETDMKRKTDYLLDSSTTFRDLEQLVVAFDALETWKAAADTLTAESDPKHATEYKAEFKQCLELVEAAIWPILGDEWLRSPVDEKENVELHTIRRQYLPELIIAYNTVLAVSGQFLTREILLKSMELAAVVAAPNSNLSAIFVEAGRVSELVDALAMSSRTMLRADELGMRNIKKFRRGVASDKLGIWTPRREQVIKRLQEAAKKKVIVEP